MCFIRATKQMLLKAGVMYLPSSAGTYLVRSTPLVNHTLTKSFVLGNSTSSSTGCGVTGITSCGCREPADLPRVVSDTSTMGSLVCFHTFVLVLCSSTGLSDAITPFSERCAPLHLCPSLRLREQVRPP